jgi:hypothetical protein
VPFTSRTGTLAAISRWANLEPRSLRERFDYAIHAPEAKVARDVEAQVREVDPNIDGRLEVRELTVDAQVAGDRLLNPLPVCDRLSEAVDGRRKPLRVQPVDRRHRLLERFAAEVPVRRATSRARQPRRQQH